jgi:HEAT repeat protein
MNVLGTTAADSAWFSQIAVVVSASLLALNLFLVLAIALHRLRERRLAHRRFAFEADSEELLAELNAETSVHGAAYLRAMNLLAAGGRRWIPWHRANAVAVLGRLGDDEAVPLLVRRLSDRNRRVREAAVRALGRIGDDQALEPLARLFAAPGRVGAGVVHTALVAFVGRAEPVFAAGLESEIDSVRIDSCFGIAALAAPETARQLVTPLLDDDARSVRAAAAEALATLPGRDLPEGLARAARDPDAPTRGAAVLALGACENWRAVELAIAALDDPDRDVARLAGETLVRLSNYPVTSTAAHGALATNSLTWPVERAVILDAIARGVR